MKEGKLYFINKTDPNRPIEEKFITEIDGVRKSFIDQDNAMLYLFDEGVRKFNYLTKEIYEYKDPTNFISYEIWHIENRIGYILYDYQLYVDENKKVKKRKSYIWRFIGYGRSCFAQSKEELREKVISTIKTYNEDAEGRGYTAYPFYTKFYRNNK